MSEGHNGRGRNRPLLALTRYHASLLIRSHRWIPPAVLYLLGVVFLGSAGSPDGAALAQALSWSALMLVPCAAWLTRAVLTAEPAAARACVAAASGPRRAQLAALIAALGGGAVFGVAGVAWGLITNGVIRSAAPAHAIEAGATASVLFAGLSAAAVCLLVGGAAGAAFNPPVVRRPALAMLGTTVAVVLGLAWSGSPANAAVRSAGYGLRSTSWPPGLPVFVAIALLVIAWAISIALAARRSG
jgi:hypothetical protein